MGIIELMSDIKDTEKQLVQALEGLGYNVKLSKRIVKKTFEIDFDLLQVFFILQKQKQMKVKDAIHEAISDWIKKGKK